MSGFTLKGLLGSKSPLLQFQRFRGKINIQKPRQPHYERARVIAVTTPIYKEPPKNRDCFALQVANKKNEKPHNPYNDIIAKEVLNWFNHSKMVGLYHMNPIAQEEVFKVRVALHKENMVLKSYGKQIITQAMENSKYEAIMPLFVSQYCIVFSPEQKVAKLLRITKKVPQLILLGGILEGTLLSKNEFTNFARMPDLQTARAQLVGVLNSAAGQIVNNLEAHQKMLVNVLDVHAKSGESSPDSDRSGEISEQTEGVVKDKEGV